MKKHKKKAVTIKRKRGRPCKVVIERDAVVNTIGLPILFQPTEYDIVDELSRLDSFIYGNHDS